MMYRCSSDLIAVSFATLLAVGLVGCSDDSSTSPSDAPDTSTEMGDTQIMDTDDGDDPGDDVLTDTDDPDSGGTEQMDSGGTDTTVDGGSDDNTRGEGSSSRITRVTFRKSVTDDNPDGCCRDFSGHPNVTDDDNNADSALGDLIDAISDLTGLSLEDINTETNTLIDEGGLVFLVEYGADWSDPMNDSGFDLFAHSGLDASIPFDTDDDGVGEFRIDPSSFNADGEAISELSDVSVTNGDLSASNGTLYFDLQLGTTGLTSGFTIHDARLSGAVVDSQTTLESNGEVTLTDGEISGIVSDDDLFTAINKIQDQRCGCLDNPMFTKSNDEYVCTNYCASDAEAPSACKELSCAGAEAAFHARGDANLDGQGPSHDYTFGMEFEAEGADITGVGNP